MNSRTNSRRTRRTSSADMILFTLVPALILAVLIGAYICYMSLAASLTPLVQTLG